MTDTKELRELLAFWDMELTAGLYPHVLSRAAVNALPGLLHTQDALVEALKFYADGRNWAEINTECDQGDIARAALAKVGK